MTNGNYQPKPDDAMPPQGQYQPPPHLWLGPAQTPQPQGQPDFQPRQPSPKKNTGLRVVVLIVGALMLLGIGGTVGYGQGVGHKVVVTETTPGPTITQIGPTETVRVTVTPEPIPSVTQKAGSTNVQVLESVWPGLSESDRTDLRAEWKDAKGNATDEAAVIKEWKTTMKSLTTLTDAEIREFLDWTLTH